jgi:hypothetical protein
MKLNFKPLIAEKDEKGEYTNVSLGRISFWIVFGIAIYVWLTGTGDIQASHLQMLYITATYNLMKKATWFGNIKSGDTQMQITHEAEEDDIRPPRV